MDFLYQLQRSFLDNADQNAFCIDNIFYSYKSLSTYIEKIRQLIQEHTNNSDKRIGLILHDDIETYASIFALWMEGRAYVPLNPEVPQSRNIEIVNSTDLSYVLNSLGRPYFNKKTQVLQTNGLPQSDSNSTTLKRFSKDDIAYILFTSGSTGKPKGIPISFGNLNALINAVINDTNFLLSKTDRCLQMYDLTFDASLTALLPGLYAGACIFTVPANSMKYLHIFKLLTTYKLTVLKMVPSIIHYLRPYFAEIKADHVRYCIFGGGKLYEDILMEWMPCVPNSKILNHYGPTEFTVCSSYYEYELQSANKTHHGIVAIGKPWSHVSTKIIKENGAEADIMERGELCLAGAQLTAGYWKNEELTKMQFFTDKDSDGDAIKFYRTGDICYKDEEGDIFYVERKDFQVKIRGNRVELGEIEFYAKKIIKDLDLAVVDVVNEINNTELAMVITSEPFDLDETKKYLKDHLPNYMIPTKYKFVKELPLNVNGKVDRKAIQLNFNTA